VKVLEYDASQMLASPSCLPGAHRLSFRSIPCTVNCVCLHKLPKKFLCLTLSVALMGFMNQMSSITLHSY